MVALPICQITLKAQKPLKKPYPVTLTTIGDHIKKKRLDRNLFQKDVAALIGVKKESVYNWENNRSQPKISYLPKIIEFLGYMPFDLPKGTIGDKIRVYRKIHGLSQRKFAKLLRIDEATIRDWESKKRRPGKNSMGKFSECFDISEF